MSHIYIYLRDIASEKEDPIVKSFKCVAWIMHDKANKTAVKVSNGNVGIYVSLTKVSHRIGPLSYIYIWQMHMWESKQ